MVCEGAEQGKGGMEALRFKGGRGDGKMKCL